MAEIEPLIKTSQLKTTLIAQLVKNKAAQMFVNYDTSFDALMLLFVSPEIETIVHYLDDQVALLYQPETLEIVGLQIEDFESRFLPAHDSVRKVWRLSDTDSKLEDFGDLMLTIERKKPNVAREVLKATEDVLGEQGAALLKVLV